MTTETEIWRFKHDAEALSHRLTEIGEQTFKKSSYQPYCGHCGIHPPSYKIKIDDQGTQRCPYCNQRVRLKPRNRGNNP